MLTAPSLAGGLQLFYPQPAYAFFIDLGLYNGATPLLDGQTFAVGFVDGFMPGQPPTNQGGMYTVTATP